MCLSRSLSPPELIRADMADMGFREGASGIFDAIITDPPYGVRAAVLKSDESHNKSAVAGLTEQRLPNALSSSQHDSSPVDAICSPAEKVPPDNARPPAPPDDCEARPSFARTKTLEGEMIFLNLLDFAARVLRIGALLYKSIRQALACACTAFTLT